MDTDLCENKPRVISLTDKDKALTGKEENDKDHGKSKVTGNSVDTSKRLKLDDGNEPVLPMYFFLQVQEMERRMCGYIDEIKNEVMLGVH